MNEWNLGCVTWLPGYVWHGTQYKTVVVVVIGKLCYAQRNATAMNYG
jgi:hypothetical protein